MRKSESLAKTIATIEKRYGVSITEASMMPKMEVVSTGLKNLDDALGIKGIKKGSIVEIYGSEGVGKTSLALHLVSQYQKAGMSALYIDSEKTLSREIIQTMGVKEDELFLFDVNNLGDALDACILATLSFGVIVIDSLAGLPTKMQQGCHVEDLNIGTVAKIMSNALPVLLPALSKSGCTLIITNQIREKVGVIFGKPTISTGGNALKYYATQRLELTRIETLKNKGGAMGFRILARVMKNKVFPSLKEANFDIIFGEGIKASS